MKPQGLFRLSIFLFFRFFKADQSLIELAKQMPAVSGTDLDKTFKVLRKIIGYLPVKNECFLLSLVMFSLCGEQARMLFAVTDKNLEKPLCHAWVEWQDLVFTSDYGFQGSVVWTHSK